jgi:hypothetical protein
MVAITVVLAAVLYLLVSGMIPPPGSDEPINLSDGRPTGNLGEWKVELAGATSGNNLASYKVALLNGTAIDVVSTTLEDIDGSCALPGPKGNANIAFTDVQGDNKLNQGDWFIVCGTDDVHDYHVQLFWKISGNKVSGDTGKIQQ